jgi:phytoene dehydrogenase-like protein
MIDKWIHVLQHLLLSMLSSVSISFRIDQSNTRLGFARSLKKTQSRFRVLCILGANGNPASICIIGGGVSGLTAAITAAKNRKGGSGTDIVLLESSPTIGGRVQSDVTQNGLILDRGFAVFIEEYPFAKYVLDYDSLKLRKFLPGALIKVSGKKDLARVADPLRQPLDVFAAVFADVGSFVDKVKVLPLVFHVKMSSISELFNEPETDTLSSLRYRWGFSDDIIDKFFKPFLEGIYLSPLEQQSSRMFLFVFKMFSEGAATLPEGGMGVIAKQLFEKAIAAGIDIRTHNVVTSVSKENSLFKVKASKGEILAKSVIVATDGPSARTLLATVDGLESLAVESDQPQRSVGCVYYSFEGKSPVEEPILILNGISSSRGDEENPVNNICFPSVVSHTYTSPGIGICSVTVLENAMSIFEGRDDDLDLSIRGQLSSWFPDHKDEILNKWKFERMYKIQNAQPSQIYGPQPANENGGRPCNSFRGVNLPEGLFVCGDHVATATLNGALESGVNAGNAAAKII